jgi:hypothetical protein
MLLNGKGESQEVRDKLIGASCFHVLHGRAASRWCQDSERCTPPSLEVPRSGSQSLTYSSGICHAFKPTPLAHAAVALVAASTGGQTPSVESAMLLSEEEMTRR